MPTTNPMMECRQISGKIDYHFRPGEHSALTRRCHTPRLPRPPTTPSSFTCFRVVELGRFRRGGDASISQSAFCHRRTSSSMTLSKVSSRIQCQLVAITSPLVNLVSYVQALGSLITKAHDVARYVVHLGANGVR